MSGSITHFEIYGIEPETLASFYREVFGWQIDQMQGVDYWRVETGAPDGVRGGLMYRTIPGVNGWMFYVKVESLDKTVADIERLGGTVVRPRTAVPKTAWVTIVSDPQGSIFGVWEADATALPMPEPD